MIKRTPLARWLPLLRGEVVAGRVILGTVLIAILPEYAGFAARVFDATTKVTRGDRCTADLVLKPAVRSCQNRRIARDRTLDSFRQCQE